MNIIDRINAPAAQKPEVGKIYKIEGIAFAMVDDQYSRDPGAQRPQAIIHTPDGSVYAPGNVAHVIKEFVDKGCTTDDLEADLNGHVMEVYEQYSNKWRRMIVMGRIK